MSDLARLMQARFRRLMLDFEMTFSAEQISHSGERGRLLEEALRAFLISVLPSRIGVGSGQIVEALKPEPSKQVDIVLYDALNYPLLLNEGSFQLFLNESVLAVIEVKSTLNKKFLNEGVENIASSKVLRKFPEHYPATLGVLFCYKTSWKRPQTLFRNLRKTVKAGQGHVPGLICSLDPGFLLAATGSLGKSVTNLGTPLAGMEKDSKFPPGKFVLIRPFGDFSQECILLWFYLLLIDYLNRTLDTGVNVAQYTKSSVAWSTDLIDLGDIMGYRE